MRRVAVAALMLAMAAQPTRPGAAIAAVRLPGTALRFGAAPEVLDTTFVAVPGDSTLLRRRGPMAFFGVPATATLEFRERRLVGGEFLADSLSPAAAAYIEDELVHQGYRRHCARWQPDAHTCDWSGRAEIHLEIAGRSARATVREAVPRLAAAAAADPPSGAKPPGERGDVVLEGGEPAVLDSCRAVRPVAARKAGVFGTVLVQVSVDTLGVVRRASVAHGVPELDEAALECARHYRFQPYLVGRRPQEFLKLIAIRFTR